VSTSLSPARPTIPKTCRHDSPVSVERRISSVARRHTSRAMGHDPFSLCRNRCMCICICMIVYICIYINLSLRMYT